MDLSTIDGEVFPTFRETFSQLSSLSDDAE